MEARRTRDEGVSVHNDFRHSDNKKVTILIKAGRDVCMVIRIYESWLTVDAKGLACDDGARKGVGEQ